MAFTARQWAVASALLLAGTLLLQHEWRRVPDGRLRIDVLDIGQGDSVLLTTPGAQRILVDGGPDLSALEEMGGMLPFLNRRIDLLILTHPDADHISAFPDILERYDVARVMLTGVQQDSSIYDRFLAALDGKGVPVIIAEAGRDLDLGAGVLLDILWPLAPLYGETPTQSNSAGIVAKLRWRSHSVLLTADIEAGVEEELLRRGTDLSAEILKIPHHGSRTSSSLSFLHAVQPQLALLSVGRNNRFGHPHPEVLARYARLGIPIRSTAQEGRISIVLE